MPPPPRSTLFPYTTLFRSVPDEISRRYQLFECGGRRDPETFAPIRCRSALRRLHNGRSEEHTSELQSRPHLVCRLLLEKKKITQRRATRRDRRSRRETATQ